MDMMDGVRSVLLVVLGHNGIELLEVQSFIVVGLVVDEHRVQQLQYFIVINQIS
jgi:hypothetical protein